jgi:hypothetical protein
MRDEADTLIDCVQLTEIINNAAFLPYLTEILRMFYTDSGTAFVTY